MQGTGAPRKHRARIPFVFAAPVLLACVGTVQIVAGEVIPVSGGLGWDGRFYANVAADLPRAVSGGEIDVYHVRRIVPSAMVWFALHALGRPLDAEHARETFAWLNLAFQLLTLAAWTAAARRTGLDEGGLWLGFVLLFFNFANLKMPFYYAPLTDSAAQALGAALLYFHVARRPVGMVVVLVLGAFTWASFLVFGGLLFVYPLESTELRRAPRWWPPVLVSSAVIAFSALVLVHRADVARLGGSAVAAVVVAAYLGRVVGDLAGGDAVTPSLLLRRPALARWAVVMALAAAAVVAARALGAPTRFGTGYFLRHLAIYSLARPGLFLVAHAAYFGLVVAVIAVFWPQVVASVHRLGTGFTLFVLAHLVWGIHPESRQIVDGLPALALVATSAASTRCWPRATIPTAAVLALIASKVWLPINHGGFLGRSDPETYPAQYYFMNQGPWMASGPYLVQAAALVAACALLWVVRRRLPPAPTAEAAAPPIAVPSAVLGSRPCQ